MLNKLQDVKDPFHFLSLKLKLGLTFTFLWAVPIGYAIIYFKDPMHFLLFVSPLFLISLIFPYWFLIKPLEKIKKGAKMLSMGFLDYRIKNHSNNELGLVSKSFNHMADCIQDRTLALENNSEILKNKTKELNFAKDKFKSILAAMNDGVLYLNLQGEVVHANPGGKLLESILSSKGRRPPNIKHCRQGKIIGEECFTCLKKN